MDKYGSEKMKQFLNLSYLGAYLMWQNSDDQKLIRGLIWS